MLPALQGLATVRSIRAMWERLGRAGRARIAIAAGALAAVVVAVAVVFVVVRSGGSDASTPAATATATPSATSTNTATATATVDPSPTPIAHAGILDGVPMSDAEWAARNDLLPLAVMIDNTASANPHAGLSRADLVYEAFVEGGITRLMAVYWRQDADKIMPVRSARTPFVNWVSELDALYGHAGGAITQNEADAVGQIIQYGIKDLNAFSPVSSNYYYRDHDRPEPYNLATSTSYLREAADQLGLSGPPKTLPWHFREPGQSLPPGAPAGGIEVDYSGRLYAWQYIQWRWDAAKARYLRYQFGGPEVDVDTGEQLAFATVIVMRVPSHVVDESGHVILDQVGSGPATVFTGGQAYEGTWNKESRTAHTTFLSPRGDPIVFERGPIFIQVIGEQSAFDYTAAPGDLRELPAYEPPPPGSGIEIPDEPPPATVTATPTEAPSRTATAVTPRPSATASAVPGSPTAKAGTAVPTAEGTPSPPGSPPAVSPSPSEASATP